MANVIKIKRSTTTPTPAGLAEGELAYSENSDNFFIGTAGGNIQKIGGNTDVLKLAGIEDNATRDQTNAEIKTAYEANANTNEFSDAEQTKLAGIAAGAEVNVKPDFNATSGDAQILNVPDPKITLSGDATGSVTLTNLANGTLAVTVVDDSHNHIIDNVDGLQAALNSKEDNHSHPYLSDNHDAKNVTNTRISNWDTAYNLIAADSDGSIDKINEVFAAFSNVTDDGSFNLIASLNSKMDDGQVIDGGTF